MRYERISVNKLKFDHGNRYKFPSVWMWSPYTASTRDLYRGSWLEAVYGERKHNFLILQLKKKHSPCSHKKTK